MEALRAGALTVLEKPAGTTNADYQSAGRTLVHAVGHHEPGQAGSAERRGCDARRTTAFHRLGARIQARSKMLGITCSTGGPQRAGAIAGCAGTGLPFADPVGPAHDRQLHAGLRVLAGRAFARFRVTIVNDGCDPGCRDGAHGSGRAASAIGRRAVAAGCWRSSIVSASLGDGAVSIHGARSGRRCAGRTADRHGRRWRVGPAGYSPGRRIHHRRG